MTVDELKKKFVCTDDRCVHARTFRDIFLMMHAIGRMIETMPAERLERLTIMVNDIVNRTSGRALAEMLATGINLTEMGVLTIANTIAGFELLNEQAIVHEMAREFTNELERKTKCSGLIQ